MTKHPKQIEILARGISIRDGKILLCKNKKSNYWYLPGGHVEPGETAARALRREFEEETGKIVPVGRLVFIHEHFFRQDNKPRHEYSFVFEATAPAAIKAKEKHLEFAWTNWADVSRLDVKPRSLFQMVGVFLEEHAMNRVLKFGTTRG